MTWFGEDFERHLEVSRKGREAPLQELRGTIDELLEAYTTRHPEGDVRMLYAAVCEMVSVTANLGEGKCNVKVEDYRVVDIEL